MSSKMGALDLLEIIQKKAQQKLGPTSEQGNLRLQWWGPRHQVWQGMDNATENKRRIK